MSDYCGPCKGEGRGVVIAHYAGVSAGKSPTGKAIPPMCWHHRFGKPLPAISAPPVVNAPDSVTVEAPPPKPGPRNPAAVPHEPAPPKAAEPSSTNSFPEKRNESKSMNANQTPIRLCAREGCGKQLRSSNATGFCHKHWYDSKSKSDHRDNAPSPSRRSRPSQSKDVGVATICVTEAHLDSFWAKLSLEEKAQIFERQLEGAR